ncbi:MAG: hypothetical protein M1827_004114 [Pycnora praestabilis]|nr:MAG: hypothetical protein M1827_004114 [Pycnora praestabilis]
MTAQSHDSNFPCSLTISLPFPTARLASSALRALEVDKELSPLVRRSFALTTANAPTIPTVNGNTNGASDGEEEKGTVLRTEYIATTNRMLRVAVNGFMESLGVVIGVMEELDIDVLIRDER